MKIVSEQNVCPEQSKWQSTFFSNHHMMVLLPLPAPGWNSLHYVFRVHQLNLKPAHSHDILQQLQLKLQTPEAFSGGRWLFRGRQRLRLR
jgi:hypothetical protein